MVLIYSFPPKSVSPATENYFYLRYTIHNDRSSLIHIERIRTWIQ